MGCWWREGGVNYGGWRLKDSEELGASRRDALVWHWWYSGEHSGLPFMWNSIKDKTGVKERWPVVAWDLGLGRGLTTEGQEGTFWILEIFCILIVVMKVIHLYVMAKIQQTMLRMSRFYLCILKKTGGKESETNSNFFGSLHMCSCFGMIPVLNYIWDWQIMRFPVRDS